MSWLGNGEKKTKLPLPVEVGARAFGREYAPPAFRETNNGGEMSQKATRAYDDDASNCIDPDYLEPGGSFMNDMKQITDNHARSSPRSMTAKDKDAMDTMLAADCLSSMSLRAVRDMCCQIMAAWKGDKPPTGIELAELSANWAFGVVHPEAKDESKGT
jgi:hypothetical protein